MGTYTFRLSKNSKARKALARYTYVYKRTDGQWKIINHPSSPMPEHVS
ncbi:nuclear transport factor 2 family protein [Dyella sp. LX-66]|nr:MULTISPECIES: nuclear transport factor 2 family protein [unclassified Dyella]MBT2116999.1 nuclear transport factor 2 family protein [Dyella sp. LX-1]MBT2139925.1 nuclear transport factor 2 family protein [Dyella sp. LX-66]